MSVLEGLNDRQREAVLAVGGPVLVLAGAGSGKTRVLTHRIAYLIGELGVHPGKILAMTFTNKAAGEMRDRVEGLLKRTSRGMWIGTFHSLCSRILRAEAEAVGLRSNFAIYDSDDQLTLLRQVIRDQELSDKQFPPQRVRSRISSEKSRMVDAEAFARGATSYYDQQVARIYRQYQSALTENNAADFDDLLMLSVKLFETHPDRLEAYKTRFEHILIDEYQDTNRPQYLFSRRLAEGHQNICVVGDDDQSIYAWRGADLRNILDFEKDFPDARVIRLERNYRSTQVILDAGNAVIRNNLGRKGKELWTDRSGGERIGLKRCMDEVEEAGWVADTAQFLAREGAGTFGGMAVLYRTNAQSRALEEGLRRGAIPYVVVGGVRFYERKEVKDVLAYLRLLVNTRDSISLNRIINTPRRGIGTTSLDRLDGFAMREGIAPYDALGRLGEIEGLPARARKSMEIFYHGMEELRADLERLDAGQLAEAVVQATGVLESFRELPPVESQSRRENVEELLAGVQDFAERSEDPSLEAFLREVSLLTDVDQWSRNADAMTLMTLHSAKGLEFPVVFLTGMEEGLCPLLRTWDEEADDEEALEEERRLCYVGITRAEDRLFLTHANQRRRYGGAEICQQSRFLEEIPQELIGTGAWAERELPPEEEDPESGGGAVLLDFEVGDWVVHPSWGRGQIEASSGRGENAKLVIRFVAGAVKKVVARFAHLEPG
ncbi:MAG: UvrD-helicase domain-containing protein [Candidatus Latescibacteria bacterium]|jgi:DNA helicase-2/ATP-dependent DNA helicase PcrA|nr:UvrD-helicase domain-containing protein [Candidatus Latescibacterota bacterium]